MSRALAAVPSELAQLLVAVVEDQWFERKSSRIEPRKLAEAMVGFANADGGVIAVGLYSGSIEGTRKSNRHRNELMQTAMNFTQPTVTAKATLHACINDRGEPDDVLIFEIPPGSTVYATNRDEVFLRVGDETRRLSFTQRRELLYDKGQAAFETEINALTLGDLDDDLLRNYADNSGRPTVIASCGPGD